ncbi:MAG: cyclic nucleotide-binding domain-containing protein, partial [Bacteroidetes bacterium]|nr:cyclic nucleotide-binding domain-containing protein [Bacteroidota bacterium]
MYRQNNITCKDCKNDCLIKEISDPALLDEIENQKLVSRYKSGQEIIFEGMRAMDIKFVNEGKVKVYKRGGQGKIKILRFSKKGDIFGHRSLHT